jgi:nicotinamidase-related amidase
MYQRIQIMRKRVLVTVTTIDPKTALIVIDLQQGIVSLPTVHPIAEMVKHARTLADAFRRQSACPSCSSTSLAEHRAERNRPPRNARVSRRMDRPHPRTEPAAATDIVVTKRTWGAFTNTDLEAHLKALGVTQVVIVGVATSDRRRSDRAPGL